MPKPVFHIFSEGLKSEPEYIAAYIRRIGDILFEVHMVPGVGVARTVVREACNLKEKLESELEEGESLEGTDSFWAVFDHDGADLEYKSAVDESARCGVKLACSNPCFELWYLLHLEVYDRPNSHRDLQREVADRFIGYDREKNKTIRFDVLFPFVEIAEQRADTLVQRRSQDLSPAPITFFHCLTRALRQASKPAGTSVRLEIGKIEIKNPIKRTHSKTRIAK